MQKIKSLKLLVGSSSIHMRRTVGTLGKKKTSIQQRETYYGQTAMKNQT